jgi:hypothetical protein
MGAFFRRPLDRQRDVDQKRLFGLGVSAVVDDNHYSFAWRGSWFEREYGELCGRRWPTLKAALNLFLQRGGKTIVETGCMRQENDYGAGCSTLLFSRVAATYGACLWSVDNNPDHVALATRLTSAYAASRHCVVGDSVDFLQSRLKNEPNFSSRIDLLYLDSLDYPADTLAARFGCTNMQQFAELLADTSEEELCAGHRDLIGPPQAHCLAEIQAAIAWLHPGSVVLMDDNHLPGGGKPRLAKRALSELGWICVLDAEQSLWLLP